MAFMMISHKPEWTWVFPKDGALLSTVLATTYKEQVRAVYALADPRDNWWPTNTNCFYVKDVNAMYDFIGQYKYYKKTLPRSVALDVVIAALTHLMPKKK